MNEKQARAMLDQPLPRIERVDSQTLTTAAMEGVYDLGYQKGFEQGRKFGKENQQMSWFLWGILIGVILIVIPVVLLR